MVLFIIINSTCMRMKTQWWAILFSIITNSHLRTTSIKNGRYCNEIQKCPLLLFEVFPYLTMVHIRKYLQLLLYKCRMLHDVSFNVGDQESQHSFFRDTLTIGSYPTCLSVIFLLSLARDKTRCMEHPMRNWLTNNAFLTIGLLMEF